MNLVNALDIPEGQPFSISWDITPIYTFTMFESWGGKDGERVRDNDEKFYYFFIDGWKSPVSLYLMERGVKHARVIARINAPQELIDKSVADDGRSLTLDKSYAINSDLRKWLKENVVENTADGLVSPMFESHSIEDMTSNLPGLDDAGISPVEKIDLRSEPGKFDEHQVPEMIRTGGFFDIQENKSGNFTNHLVDNQDDKTVTDLSTGLMWERGGHDITNFKKVKTHTEDLNRQEFGGYTGWRIPTIEEAMSLMTSEVSVKGLHIHPCFSKEQPFIFTADQRLPGGYWFVDYKHGAVFWASGSIPGGFGRACRTA